MDFDSMEKTIAVIKVFLSYGRLYNDMAWQARDKSLLTFWKIKCNGMDWNIILSCRWNIVTPFYQIQYYFRMGKRKLSKDSLKFNNINSPYNSRTSMTEKTTVHIYKIYF